jgi:hypothetical protein
VKPILFIVSLQVALLPSLFFANGACAQTVAAPNARPPANADTNRVEVKLQTDGAMEITGASRGKASVRLVAPSAPALSAAEAATLTTSATPANANKKGAKADTLLKVTEDEDGLHVLAQRSRARPSHGKLQMALPKNQALFFDASQGDIRVSGTEGTLCGRVKKGRVVLSDVKGGVDIVSDEGDMVVNSAQGMGQLRTRKGDIVLEDSDPMIGAYTLDGRVVSKFSTAYLKNLAKQQADNGKGQDKRPAQAGRQQCQLRLQSTDAELGTVTDDISLNLQQGNATIANAQANVSVSTGKGNITIAKADKDVVAATHQGDVSCTLSAASSAKCRVELVSDQGSVTVRLPRNFSGTVQIESIGVGSSANTGIVSDFPLPENKEETLKDQRGQTLATERKLTHRFGNSEQWVRVRAVNGKVFLVANQTANK